LLYPRNYVNKEGSHKNWKLVDSLD
jgi:hypothetical protein